MRKNHLIYTGIQDNVKFAKRVFFSQIRSCLYKYMETKFSEGREMKVLITNAKASGCTQLFYHTSLELLQ